MIDVPGLDDVKPGRWSKVADISDDHSGPPASALPLPVPSLGASTVHQSSAVNEAAAHEAKRRPVSTLARQEAPQSPKSKESRAQARPGPNSSTTTSPTVSDPSTRRPRTLAASGVDGAWGPASRGYRAQATAYEPVGGGASLLAVPYCCGSAGAGGEVHAVTNPLPRERMARGTPKETEMGDKGKKKKDTAMPLRM